MVIRKEVLHTQIEYAGTCEAEGNKAEAEETKRKGIIIKTSIVNPKGISGVYSASTHETVYNVTDDF